MDFFERQEKARRHTAFLVFYFAIAIALLILAVYAAVALIFGGVSLKDSSGETTFSFLQPELFVETALATLGVIAMGTVFKTMALARGGRAVAELLDGRLVNSNTTDPNERKLLNVVEEMAIASGVPVPQVYVMDSEDGINAFAAGHSASDAAVSVTRGCMTMLTRDELQGVQPSAQRRHAAQSAFDGAHLWNSLPDCYRTHPYPHPRQKKSAAVARTRSHHRRLDRRLVRALDPGRRQPSA